MKRFRFDLQQPELLRMRYRPAGRPLRPAYGNAHRAERPLSTRHQCTSQTSLARPVTDRNGALPFPLCTELTGVWRGTCSRLRQQVSLSDQTRGRARPMLNVEMQLESRATSSPKGVQVNVLEIMFSGGPRGFGGNAQ
jgi:hypothetical protein